MLGNWSFGDYYKEEAIRWHWDLITKVWGVDPGLLYATVHKDDKESEDIWIKLDVLPRDRILQFGDKDNFWEMGETGPCGPNSEISIDRGEAACSPEKNHAGQKCFVNVDGCERFIELGNLVFIQYNRDGSGVLTPLPKKHVDTGTGLERTAAALQSLETGKILGNYDIDLFQTIVHKIEEAAQQFGDKARYGQKEESDISFRAIADHARTMTFLIADGIVPGNTDREYVLRRIIRRAARHGRYLGIHRPFLAMAHAGVVEAMGAAYPEIKAAAAKTADVITQEESRFGETLDRGLELIDSELARIKQSGGHTLPGEVAFKLYDTYGFPLDLTEDVLRNHSIDVDLAGFNRLMDEQKERGRAARKDDAVAPEISLGAGTASRFVGYHSYESESEVLAARRQRWRSRRSRRRGDALLSRRRRPGRRPRRYRDGVGRDSRSIRHAQGRRLDSHVGRILRGEAGDFARGARVTLKVDRLRRDAARLNHSATHILHYALRDVLGSSVHQAGSLVDPDKLRFDFAHQGPVKDDALATIEEEINARIRENAAVTVEEMAYDDAIKAGALAFFGDESRPRARGQDGRFFGRAMRRHAHLAHRRCRRVQARSGIRSRGGRAANRSGDRTGRARNDSQAGKDSRRDWLAARRARRPAVERLEKLLAREKELEKKLRAMEQKLASGDGGAVSEEDVRDIHGVKVVTRKLDGVDPRTMREMADRMRQKHGSAVVALGSDLGEGKVALLVAVTPDFDREDQSRRHHQEHRADRWRHRRRAS